MGLILGQVGLLRARLNRLAIQQGLFESLSLAVGSGAIIFLAALLLEPLKFLLVAAVLSAVLIAGLSRAIRRAYRSRASTQRAAQVADERAGLKGRLATVVSLASGASQRGPLWPYLIEDTLSLREEFVPARVEPRRVSRSIYGLLAYCLLAALVLLFALSSRRAQQIASRAATSLDVDVNSLDVRPMDPDLGTSVEVTGDAAAMRKLADKLARAENQPGESDSRMARLMGRARDLASNLQDRMTGHRTNRLRLHLTDSGDRSEDERPPAAPPSHPGGSEPEQSAQNSAQPGDEHSPLAATPGAKAQRGPGDAQSPQQGLAGQLGGHDPSNDPSAQPQQGEQSGGGGASHGSGSDPQNLFGQAEEPPLGSEGFEIMIEARPADRGPRSSGQSYLPPKVRASLNPHQHPDEPIARSAVPDEDRASVKRVFDR